MLAKNNLLKKSKKCKYRYIMYIIPNNLRIK